jgi:(2R)-3-sulfolactate dehydrogenase (NADP+)
VVIDGAISQVARGKLMVAALRGEPVPDGWGFDSGGRPTNDPKAILHGGSMGAIGGAKGAAFALMIDMLCGPLTGSGLAVEATPFEVHDGPPPRLGQFFLVIDPALSGGGGALARIEALAGHVIDSDGARLPGGDRAARRAEAHARGIALNPDLRARLAAL